MPSIDELRAAANPALMKRNTKYQAKLTYSQRCECVAAVHFGFTPALVAVAYGINRATLRYMTNFESKYYKNVRDEFLQLGGDKFVEKYLSHTTIQTIQSFANDPEVKMSSDEVKAHKSAHPTRFDPKATRREGVHKVKFGPFGGSEIGIQVVAVADWDDPIFAPYREYIDPRTQEPGTRTPGWYVAIFVSDTETEFAGTPSHSYSSQQALDNFLSVTMSELK